MLAIPVRPESKAATAGDPSGRALRLQTGLQSGLQIGPYSLPNRTLVAPMAGVTDRPFRQLCRRLGAGYAVSEMAASNPKLRDSVKTTRRIDHDGEIEPKAVQIAGADPAMMAEAARFNVDRGAQIIDINMGCPARKVCNVQAGSALMGDEALALRIIEAVVRAVAVPVTVKMRTGIDCARRNAVQLARAAEQAGAAMITVHGRTRACHFHGEVDYDTIAEVKASVSLPVVANGDIDSPEKAKQVLAATGADAIMIGRAAQGRPWIFREIEHYLAGGEKLAGPSRLEVWSLLRQHLLDHYAFYGEYVGVRTARKHIGWYLRGMQQGQPLQGATEALRQRINLSEAPEVQLDLIDQYFADEEQVPDTCMEPGRLPQ